MYEEKECWGWSEWWIEPWISIVPLGFLVLKAFSVPKVTLLLGGHNSLVFSEFRG
jgi:hypothetical protein